MFQHNLTAKDAKSFRKGREKDYVRMFIFEHFAANFASFAVKISNFLSSAQTIQSRSYTF